MNVFYHGVYVIRRHSSADELSRVKLVVGKQNLISVIRKNTVHH